MRLQPIYEKLVQDFKNGELDIIVNVDIFSEGFDCPDLEFVQLARPTRSLVKYIQQVGRGLRKTGISSVLSWIMSGCMGGLDYLTMTVLGKNILKEIWNPTIKYRKLIQLRITSNPEPIEKEICLKDWMKCVSFSRLTLK